MRTREIIEGLPKSVREKVEEFRGDYKRLDGDYSRYALGKREAVRTRMAGYALGLRDAGLITERGRQIVFIYMTV